MGVVHDGGDCFVVLKELHREDYVLWYTTDHQIRIKKGVDITALDVSNPPKGVQVDQIGEYPHWSYVCDQ